MKFVFEDQMSERVLKAFNRFLDVETLCRKMLDESGNSDSENPFLGRNIFHAFVGFEKNFTFKDVLESVVNPLTDWHGYTHYTPGADNIMTYMFRVRHDKNVDAYYVLFSARGDQKQLDDEIVRHLSTTSQELLGNTLHSVM